MGYSNSDVAHAWAHNDNKIYSGSNMSHRDGVLKSYYTCIGQRIQINGNIVFIADISTYSSSTSKHQNYMRGAIPDVNDNVFVFNIHKYNRGRPYFFSPYTIVQTSNGYEAKDLTEDFILFGLKYFMAEEFENCLNVDTCNKLEHKFSYCGFKEMVRWFEVTKCTTTHKLMKMKVSDFNKLAKRALYDMLKYETEDKSAKMLKKFRTLIKLMIQKLPISIIVDLINGPGSWSKYLERTAGLRMTQRYKRISNAVGFLTTSYARNKSIDGKYYPVVSGGITSKEFRQHKKKGDLIKWLLSIKTANRIAAISTAETQYRLERRRSAKNRLERYLGLSGFAHRWGNPHPIDSFNYNGTVIDFTVKERVGFRERTIDDDEYLEFSRLSGEEKENWMIAKKDWMCTQLQEDLRNYREMIANADREAQLQKEEREMYARQESEQREYISRMKQQGDSGLRQLYHEGFRVNLPYGNGSIYHGGNVLLRFNKLRNIVETSKGIKIAISECARLWKYIKRWHNSNTEFENKGMEIQSINAMYHVHSYQNDILTAGCHQIAYQEMKLIAEQLHLG